MIRPFVPDPNAARRPARAAAAEYGRGRLLDQRREHTKELRAAAIGATGQLPGVRIVLPASRAPPATASLLHALPLMASCVEGHGSVRPAPPRLIIRLFLHGIEIVPSNETFGPRQSPIETPTWAGPAELIVDQVAVSAGRGAWGCCCHARRLPEIGLSASKDLRDARSETAASTSRS